MSGTTICILYLTHHCNDETSFSHPRKLVPALRDTAGSPLKRIDVAGATGIGSATLATGSGRLGYLIAWQVRQVEALDAFGGDGRDAPDLQIIVV